MRIKGNEEPEEDNDDDNGTHADEEFCKTKVIGKQKQHPSSPTVRLKGANFQES